MINVNNSVNISKFIKRGTELTMLKSFDARDRASSKTPDRSNIIVVMIPMTTRVIHHSAQGENIENDRIKKECRQRSFLNRPGIARREHMSPG